MKRYKRIFTPYTRLKEDVKINPVKDHKTDLNIFQIIALEVIKIYKTGRINSFLRHFKYYNELIFEKSEWEKERNEYFDKVGENASAQVLWNLIISELFEKGYVDKRGSIKPLGLKELDYLYKHYMPENKYPSFVGF